MPVVRPACKADEQIAGQDMLAVDTDARDLPVAKTQNSEMRDFAQ